ncbi:MAG: YraN family protein [Hyphomonadaceae bacterium]|nr:YraN family protein [Clostridia bacterium]
MDKYNKTLGALGEQAAVQYIKKKKYKIIEQNYRCRAGEIDIIAMHKGELVFIEVKSRRDDAFGTPAEAITRYKKLNLKQSAQTYLQSHFLDVPARFDIVEVVGRIVDGKIITQSVHIIDNAIF